MAGGQIPALQDADRNALDLLEKKFFAPLPIGTLSAAAGAFLVFGALTLISGSTFYYFVYKNVSFLSHIVLPYQLPGLLAFILSVPCFVKAYLDQKKINHERKACVAKYETIVSDPLYNLNGLQEKEGGEFIAKKLFTSDLPIDYKTRVINELKNKLPDENARTPDQKKLGEMYEIAKKIVVK